MARPRIIYIPGLKPKPEPASHIEQLSRCLLAGVDKVHAPTAEAIRAGDSFELVSWTYDFYGEHRDIGQDLADIDKVIGKDRAAESDVITATSWKRRVAIALFRAADLLPFALPKLATEEVEVHLRDFFRYAHDNNGRAQAARDLLKTTLRAAANDDRPVLLLAHSMGSVIAFDALWQMSREQRGESAVAMLLTIGSPLGQKIVQRHLLGAKSTGRDRYPDNIDSWVNIAAVGELTAIDRRLQNDFAPMVRLGLVSEIVDHEVFNYYHMHGALNVHAEYGYLVNEVTARVVSDWWREQTRAH
jgi:surfactin synthase thioesterase subunit